MQLTGYQTKLVQNGDSLEELLKNSLPPLPERSIVIIASKIVATCEGRFVEKKTGARDEKHALAVREAELYLPASASKYDLTLTIKGNWMFANAGIDESNADNKYLLWPENPQQSVNHIWEFLRKTFHVRDIGVIMSDSHSLPLNWGVTGHGIAHCGFEALISYVGVPDLFGRPMHMEKTNVLHSVAAGASLVMGEGSEQTPLALATEVPESIRFTDHFPSQAELDELRISLSEDIYAPLLTAVDWQKGGGGKK